MGTFAYPAAPAPEGIDMAEMKMEVLDDRVMFYLALCLIDDEQWSIYPPAKRKTEIVFSRIPNLINQSCPCNLQAPPPSTPYYKCLVSRKAISVGCKCQSLSCPHCFMSDWSVESLDFARKKEVRWQANPHLNVPFSFSDESGDMSPLCTDVPGEETEKTLPCSSRSFSYDSSCESSHSLDTIARQPGYYETFNKPIGNRKVSNVRKIKNVGHQVSLSKWKRSKTVTSPEIPSPVRSSVLKRMISCKVDGKVSESVAVVKKSQDPHRDFKRSMLEMILGRQIFEAEDLEELLQCSLSLNSRQYHGGILGDLGDRFL
ncbi:hypothetical protein DKX38_003681 [Salix brachista]|uniref:Transcription repressor n=1 Tax=Salix brachista TaxID=2182728 RepID=A0A5N5NS79_9ROSI|nr:hypothetical protein DKX38_003681 [Salix brachista]